MCRKWWPRFGRFRPIWVQKLLVRFILLLLWRCCLSASYQCSRLRIVWSLRHPAILQNFSVLHLGGEYLSGAFQYWVVLSVHPGLAEMATACWQNGLYTWDLVQTLQLAHANISKAELLNHLKCMHVAWFATLCRRNACNNNNGKIRLLHLWIFVWCALPWSPLHYKKQNLHCQLLLGKYRLVFPLAIVPEIYRWSTKELLVDLCPTYLQFVSAQAVFAKTLHVRLQVGSNGSLLTSSKCRRSLVRGHSKQSGTFAASTRILDSYQCVLLATIFSAVCSGIL